MPKCDPFADYIAAKEVLTSRMVAEPYNLVQIADRLTDEMFLIDDVLISACRRLYAQRQAYSAFTLSQVTGIGAEQIATIAGRHGDTDLLEAFSHFETAHGRYVEFEIAQSTHGWINSGKTSEEIRLEQEKYRRHRGLIGYAKQGDGRAEFDHELSQAILGQSITYPVRAPLESLRRFLPNFEPTEYIIVAARTAMGKSYFAVNCLHQCALDGVPASYINLENAPKDVQKRLWQMKSGVKFDRDLTSYNAPDLRSAWDWVKACPVKVHNTGRSLSNIVNTIRRDYLERGTQLFVIDYLQLMREGSVKRGRLDELAEISAEIRALALDLKVPIIGVAQVNREAERSATKRPQLSDLRGSGDFEQDATTVIFLYRPEYYEIKTDDEGTPYPEKYADIHIAKGRNTGTALIKCRFNEVKGFYDPAPEPYGFQPGPSFVDEPSPRYTPHPDTFTAPRRDDTPF